MTISIRESCIRCGRCVKVCPAKVFIQGESKAGATGATMGSATGAAMGDAAGAAGVEVYQPEECIVCGHCVAVCPAGAVCHTEFPPEKVHAIDYAAMPTSEQVELLIAARRSMRAFTERGVPAETLDRIVAAANRAPTATNAQNLAYVLVTDPATLRAVTEYTLGVFGKIVARLDNPVVRPLLRPLMPQLFRYIRVFRSMRREYAEQGINRITRGATAMLFIHSPKQSRYGAEDANLAYQNASLVAESLGVGQVYMGFVLAAMRQDKPSRLNRLLGIASDRRIHAVMALGMPQVRYPNYIDRKEADLQRR